MLQRNLFLDNRPLQSYSSSILYMLIRIGYDIALRLPLPTAVIYVLLVHPSRKCDLVRAEDFRIEPELFV